MTNILENFVKTCTQEELTILHNYINQLEKNTNKEHEVTNEVHCTNRS